jgi:hypothetical protein
MKKEEPSILEHFKKPTLETFLVSSPPGSEADIRVSAIEYRSGISTGLQISLDDIQLHCKSDSCKGTRFFAPSTENIYPKEKQGQYLFLEYVCKNCEKSSKVYAILLSLVDRQNAKISKIGEIPAFGPPTPTRLLTILNNEREYYLKGRRAENQGMGIGAFAYYRRVVENQKNSIFDEIIKVAQNTRASAEFIESLQSAKTENQFTRAVESLKGGIPQALLIDGHNPLTLLHNALSAGLHAQSDEDCLELASSIRIVLTELAERLGEILKDQSELKAAVSRLITKKSENNINE